MEAGRLLQVKRGEDKGWENIYQVEEDLSCPGPSGARSAFCRLNGLRAIEPCSEQARTFGWRTD